MIRSTLALVLAVASAGAVAQVGVSVQVNQPGFYGRIDLGNFGPPPVVYEHVYPQPVVVVPGPVAVHQRPIYLHVPPGHAKKWSKHCHKYNACNVPVYFVKSKEYEPGYKADKGKSDGKKKRRATDCPSPLALSSYLLGSDFVCLSAPSGTIPKNREDDQHQDRNEDHNNGDLNQAQKEAHQCNQLS